LDCLDIAYKSWDKELNRTYKKLLKISFGYLDKGQIEALLKSAQRAWIKFRDSEIKYQNEECIAINYGAARYRLCGTSLAISRLTIIKYRALALKITLESLTS